MPRSFVRNLLPFLVLFAGLVAVKLAIAAGPPAFRSPAQAAVFAWPFLAVVAAAGLGGAWLAPRAGAPLMWDERVGARDRILLPALSGLLLGAALLATDLAFGWTKPLAAGHGLTSIHIPFPASVLIYPGGAVIVCVLYYLAPIPLVAWLLSRSLWRRAGDARPWWAAGLLFAAVEPLTQDLVPSMRALGPVAALVFAVDYAANVAQVAAFRRAGFLAAVVLRVALYFVWHVVPGLGQG